MFLRSVLLQAEIENTLGTRSELYLAHRYVCFFETTVEPLLFSPFVYWMTAEWDPDKILSVVQRMSCFPVFGFNRKTTYGKGIESVQETQNIIP